MNKCHDIALQLIEFKDSYAGDTLALEAACQDEQYKTLCAKVSPIISECQNAIDIITNSLLPFIERKSQVRHCIRFCAFLSFQNLFRSLQSITAVLGKKDQLFQKLYILFAILS